MLPSVFDMAETVLDAVGAMAAGAKAAGAVRRWRKTAAVEAATAAHTQATARRRARGGEEGPAGIAVICRRIKKVLLGGSLVNFQLLALCQISSLIIGHHSWKYEH